MNFNRLNSDFLSQGVRCAGWLYLPEGVERPPVVVMAHGFSAERAFGLAEFAEKFAAEGMAVFVFDYRNFGDSDGEPRNLVDPRRHIQDWEAAVAHVRSLPEVNPKKVALWGTSFSGGHVVVVAARLADISALVSQVPFVDGLSILSQINLKLGLRFIFAAIRDHFQTLIFRRAHTIPVIGDPGDFALMTESDVRAGFESILPKDSTWKNEIPARFCLSGIYRPIKSAGSVNCPALIIMAEKDSLIPPRDVERLAATFPNARLVRLPLGHFDVYTGDGFEKATALEIEFLKEQLLK